RVGLQRLQQRPLDQEALGENVVREPLAIDMAFVVREADRDHLLGLLPLVDRVRNVEPLVALQADQPAAERLREHLGDFGLADTRLAFEEQRTSHAQCEKQHGRKRAVGEIVGPGEELQRVVDGGRDFHSFIPSCPALCRASTPFWPESKTWMAGTSPAMTQIGMICPLSNAFAGVLYSSASPAA